MKTSKLLVFVLAILSASLPAWGTADKTMVGQPLPSLSLQYLKEAPDFAGKPMVVEFWATWCPPCRTSIPHLNELYKKYQEQGLVIIGVTKEKKSVVTDFLKETEMSYFAALDTDGSLNKTFGIKGIPHAVLVDKSGKIVWEGHPMSLKENQIQSVLK